MSTHKSIEELCILHQEGRISWLELVSQSEYGLEFVDWCLETGLTASDDTAFLFFEKKEVDAFAYENEEESLPIQIALV